MNVSRVIQSNTQDADQPSQQEAGETEDIYRRLAEFSSDMIAVLCEGRFVSINPAAANLLGAGDSENVRGRLLREILSAAESDFLVEQIRRTLDEKRSRTFEYNLQLSGRRFWFAGGMSPASQNSVVWTGHDITKYKRVEQEKARLDAEMENQRQRLASIVASVPGIVWESWGKPDAATQRIDFVSGYVEEMLGYSIEEWLTTPNFWLSIVHPEDRESAVLSATETFASREVGTNRFRWIARDGGIIWVEVKSVAVCDETGNPIGMRGVAVDISERRQAEELRVRRERQIALRSAMSAVLALQEPLLDVLRQCAEALAENLDAAFALIWMLDAEESMLELCASAGLDTRFDETHARIPVGESEIGQIARGHQPRLINNIRRDQLLGDREWIEKEGIIAFAGYPLLFEKRLVGVTAVFARELLAEDTLDELAVFADNIAQGIERKRIEQALEHSEARFQRSRKLESVGRWAGAIAHDFNNMLTIINGYSELSLRRLRKGSLRSNIEEIKKAGERSAMLTHQLLAFSRQQVLKLETVDLNRVIGEASNMLQRLISKDVHLITRLDSGLGYVKADSVQLSHLVVNLVANARDAMPQGGTLTIETKDFTIDENSEEFADRQISVKPGTYVKLSVGNTGAGMDETTRRHIFEPFYTNENASLETGLGLAMVYDIVKQSGGYIFVESKVGEGAVFKVYLPQVDEEVESSRGENLHESQKAGL